MVIYKHNMHNNSLINIQIPQKLFVTTWENDMVFLTKVDLTFL